MFFLFMSFAALSTIIAVFEEIVAMWMDITECKRTKAVGINIIAITVLSIPAILGYNLLSAARTGHKHHGSGRFPCILQPSSFRKSCYSSFLYKKKRMGI